MRALPEQKCLVVEGVSRNISRAHDATIETSTRSELVASTSQNLAEL
ncbi:hypothetical protein LPB19_03260 [Marinobacter salinisoli]|uniref:Uncharacterized protein n=1 Tax=Marinobacter salinisoli TaxID=2769486 RepID=A0ABX7MT03_9GAMM|nr:hypothetical protein [Marinobacter salinisoli]QSP95451.1 hypothetical protein LPB19_03260 [Marinobacter salinisoli]